MDNDFVQRLRMNGIFPSGGFNPIDAPNIGGGGVDINGILNSVMNFRNNERQQNENREDNLYYRQKGDRLAEIARQAAINKQNQMNNPLNAQGGMNVVLANGGQSVPNRPLNGETLDQARARIDKDNNDYFSVKPQYIPAEDQPTSQKSLLERGKQTIEGEQAKAATKLKNDITLEGIKSGDKIKEETAKEAEVRKTKMSGAGQISMIPDPEDPSKQIGVVVKPDGSVVRARLDDEQVGKITKSGTEKGSSAAELKAAADAKAKQDTVNNMAQETLNSIDDVFDSKSGKLKPNATGAVGLSHYTGDITRGQLPAWMPGAEARTASNKLKRLTSQTILNLVNEMKSSSGSGFAGIRNQKEFDTLSKSANSLDMLENEDDYAAELGRIRQSIIKMLQPEVGRESLGNIKPMSSHGTTLSPDDLIKKYGGQ